MVQVWEEEAFRKTAAKRFPPVKCSAPEQTCCFPPFRVRLASLQ